mmetsp:Transcript_62152/g.110106  ORF Transcript_62152/g.110106 Transcript_62152/m.110106 type:complete len:348 (-) Transcript_62152:373-1416(-)
MLASHVSVLSRSIRFRAQLSQQRNVLFFCFSRCAAAREQSGLYESEFVCNQTRRTRAPHAHATARCHFISLFSSSLFSLFSSSLFSPFSSTNEHGASYKPPTPVSSLSRFSDLLLLAHVFAQAGVQRVHLLLVPLEQLRALELERGGEAVVLDGEALPELVDVAFANEVFGNLEALELGFLGVLLDLPFDEVLDFRRRGERRLVVRLPALGRGEEEQRLEVRHDHRDESGEVRVAVDPHLPDVRRLGEDHLDLLGGDVLSLRQLEDVLLAVDDRKSAVRIPPADVAREEPAVGVDRLGGGGGGLVVAREDGRPAHRHLAAGGRLVRGVVHLGHVLELNLNHRHRRAD